jgi:hypothetical protein
MNVAILHRQIAMEMQHRELALVVEALVVEALVV